MWWSGTCVKKTLHQLLLPSLMRQAEVKLISLPTQGVGVIDLVPACSMSACTPRACLGRLQSAFILQEYSSVETHLHHCSVDQSCHAYLFLLVTESEGWGEQWNIPVIKLEDCRENISQEESNKRHQGRRSQEEWWEDNHDTASHIGHRQSDYCSRWQ